MAMEWEDAAKRACQGRLTEAQARTVVSSIMEHAGHAPITFYKARDWFTEWLADKTQSKQKATIQKHGQVIDLFLKHLGRKADDGLEHITVGDIRSFRTKLYSEGRAATTVNDLISKILSAPLTKAFHLGYIPINPCSALESLSEAEIEADTFSPEQISALIQMAPSNDWKGFILAGYYTGQRMADLANLRWNQIDLNTQIIVIQSSVKLALEWRFQSTPVFLSTFFDMEANNGAISPVFPELFGKSGSGKSGLSETFKRIMLRAGILLEKRSEALGKAGRSRNKLSFHSLRHSFNSAMANAGVPEEVRQKLTGHRDKDTHKIYTHLDIPALKEAVSRVPSISSKS